METDKRIIVNSEVVVKATAELSRKIQEELVAEGKELDIKELLDAKADKREE